MFENMEILRTAQAMATHATQRQNLIAQNIANADTPGFQSRDLKPFAEAYAASAEMPLRARKAPQHFQGAVGGSWQPEVRQDSLVHSSPNGNAVSIEAEMVNAVGVKRQHDLALTIYRSALGLLRASIGGGGR